MFRFMPPAARGIIALLCYIANTLLWALPLLTLALFKLLLPFKKIRIALGALINTIATTWAIGIELIQDAVGKTTLHVEGAPKLEPLSWYLLIANHQSWVDILVLFRSFRGRIPFLKFFLKQELIWVPVIGLCWWGLDMPFMKRYTQAQIKAKPHLRGKDIETTRKSCEKFRNIPTTVVNFVEGTRFTKQKQQHQGSQYTHLLTPKAGGIAFVLGSMGEQFQSLLDVSIFYPHGKPTFWNYLCGQVPEVAIHVRTLPIEQNLIGDYFNDEAFKLRFQQWINQLWQEKDQQLAQMAAQHSCSRG